MNQKTEELKNMFDQKNLKIPTFAVVLDDERIYLNPPKLKILKRFERLGSEELAKSGVSVSEELIEILSKIMSSNKSGRIVQTDEIDDWDIITAKHFISDYMTWVNDVQAVKK